MLELFIDAIFVIAITTGIFYTFLLVLIAIHEYYLVRRPTVVKDLPGISILKPLKGLEDQLELNLRSFFTLDYPKYEILWGLNEPDDPSIPVIQKLQKEYPEVPNRLIIDNLRIGLNPKINNLNNIYRKAQYDFILVSDSNVRVASDYLFDLINTIHQPSTGLVTSTIRGISARKLGSILDNLHMNSFIAPTVFLIKKAINLPISIGKSMFFRREVLEQIGGFYAFRDVLAEDHLMGEAVRRLGLEVRISARPINSVNVNWKLQNFFNRHVRWAKLRRNINEFYYLVEAMSNPIVTSLLYALFSQDNLSWLILGTVLVYKIFADFILDWLLNSDIRWYHYLLIPLKDLIVGFIWIVPYFSRTVVWRGNKFKIQKNTELVPI
jgi:ceramide glucosyltransferase